MRQVLSKLKTHGINSYCHQQCYNLPCHLTVSTNDKHTWKQCRSICFRKMAISTSIPVYEEDLGFDILSLYLPNLKTFFKLACQCDFNVRQLRHNRSLKGDLYTYNKKWYVIWNVYFILPNIFSKLLLQIFRSLKVYLIQLLYNYTLKFSHYSFFLYFIYLLNSKHGFSGFKAKDT